MSDLRKRAAELISQIPIEGLEEAVETLEMIHEFYSEPRIETLKKPKPPENIQFKLLPPRGRDSIIIVDE